MTQQERRPRARTWRSWLVLAVVAAVVAVVAVGLATRAPERERSAPDPVAPSSTPPSPEVPVVPSLLRDQSQPEWDPAGASLPFHDVGLDESVISGAAGAPFTGLSHAVLATVSDGAVHLQGPDTSWQSRPVPGPPLRRFGGNLDLFPEGTRVVYLGARKIWSFDVRGGPWRSMDYPEPPAGPRGNRALDVQLVPQDAEDAVLRSHQKVWRLDLDTQRAERMVWTDPTDELVPAEPEPWVLADGLLGGASRQYLQPTGPGAVGVTALGHLTRAAARPDGRLAAVRSALVSEEADDAEDRDGIVVVDPAQARATAFLPLPTQGSPWANSGRVRVLGWLGSQVLLRADLGVAGLSGLERSTLLVRWDPETGELSRVGSVGNADAVAVAVDTLTP